MTAKTLVLRAGALGRACAECIAMQIRTGWALGLMTTLAVAASACTAPPAEETKGEATSQQKHKNKDEGASVEASPPAKDMCDVTTRLQSFIEASGGSFNCVLEGGALFAGCVVAGEVTLGATCVAAVGAVIEMEFTPSPAPNCRDVPQNLNDALFGCFNQKNREDAHMSAEELDARCKSGDLMEVKTFCGRSEGSENTLFQCIGREWVGFAQCNEGCRDRREEAFGSDLCNGVATPL
jgi:hypothetical protein